MLEEENFFVDGSDDEDEAEEDQTYQPRKQPIQIATGLEDDNRGMPEPPIQERNPENKENDNIQSNKQTDKLREENKEE